MHRFSVFGLLLVAACAAAANTTICPNVFKQVSSQKGRWDGELTLRSDDDLHGMWVRVVFDKKVESFIVTDGSGEVARRGEEEREFLIKNPEALIEADVKKVIKFGVIYSGEEPKLKAVRLNAKYVCPDKSQSLQWTGSQPVDLEETEFLGDLHSGDFLSQRPTFSVVEGCGTAPLRKNKKKNNKESISKEGYWPWHLSIYGTKNGAESLICSGVLISSGHVLTAAHCVTQRKTRNVISSNLLGIKAGQYNLKGNNPEEQQLQVAHILVHPSYNPQTLENNIAIIRLTRGIVMDDFVRPVCLWEESPDSENLIRRQGYVAGFAYNEKQQYSKQLTDSKMIVTSAQECARANTDIEEFLTPKVFCAGNDRGHSTCVGNSGSSLVFPRQGAPDIFQLRGIVSVSFALQKQFVCDDSHFAVFTDVAKYLDWIRTSIS